MLDVGNSFSMQAGAKLNCSPVNRSSQLAHPSCIALWPINRCLSNGLQPDPSVRVFRHPSCVLERPLTELGSCRAKTSDHPHAGGRPRRVKCNDRGRTSQGWKGWLVGCACEARHCRVDTARYMQVCVRCWWTPAGSSQ